MDYFAELMPFFCAQKIACSASESLFYQKNLFQRSIFESRKLSTSHLPDPATTPKKDIFYNSNRACPTNGSDCGSFLTQSTLIR